MTDLVPKGNHCNKDENVLVKGGGKFPRAFAQMPHLPKALVLCDL